MITVGMNYAVLEGKEAVFERAFARIETALREAAGHRASRLFRDVNAPRSYMILSEWDDEAAFDGFIRSEAFRKVADWGREQILADRPSHRLYSDPA